MKLRDSEKMLKNQTEEWQVICGSGNLKPTSPWEKKQKQNKNKNKNEHREVKQLNLKNS